MKRLLCLAVVLASRVAVAEDTIPYTVKEGDTCQGIAAHELGDEKLFTVVHELNPGLGPQPHILKAGQILRLPKPDRDGQVTKKTGDVTAKAPQASSWHPAHIGEDLFHAWRVSSGDASAAEITLAKTAVVSLRENTVVIVFGPSRGEAKIEERNAVLENGSLRTHLGELSGKHVTVKTPASETQLGTGTALITVERTGQTIVANHGGTSASVKSNKPGTGKPVIVPDNYGSKVLPSKPPDPPRLLPPAPVWTAGPNLFGAIDGKVGDVAIDWGAVPAAAKYHVELTSDAAGRDLIREVTVDKAVTRFEAKSAPIGSFFVTVSTIDAEGFESKPSVATEVEIVAMTVVPTAVSAAGNVAVGSHVVAPFGGTCAVEGAGVAVGPEAVLRTVGVTMVDCVDAGGRTIAPIAIRVDPLPVTLAPVTGALVRGKPGSVLLSGDPALLARIHLTTMVAMLGSSTPSGTGIASEITMPAGTSAAHVDVIAMLDGDIDPTAPPSGGAIEVARLGLDVTEPVRVVVRHDPATHPFAIGGFVAVRDAGTGGGVRGSYEIAPRVAVEADAGTLTIDGDTHPRFGLGLVVSPFRFRSVVEPFVGGGVVVEHDDHTRALVRGLAGLRMDVGHRLDLRVEIERAIGDGARVEGRGGLGWRF